MFIRANFTAMTAHRNWTMHNNNIAKAIERLSTGKRINRAADDPAGLAVSEKMKLRLRLLKQDQMNAADGMSAIEVAEGNLGNISNMLNRMLELAHQASNGTYSDQERKNLDAEYQQLLSEINRTGAGTAFNSMSLFKDKGTIEGVDKTAEALSGDKITFKGNNLEAYLDGVDELLGKISLAASENDNETLRSLGIDRSNGKTDGENLRQAVIEFTKANADTLLKSPDKDAGVSGSGFEISISGGNIKVDMPKVDDESLGLSNSNLLTQEDAEKAVGLLKNAVNSVSSWRGTLGASYNRLQHTMNSLSNMEVNLTDALSRITDADMAKEMMTLVKEQLLAQTSMFAMAQARQQPEQVLTLLKTL